MTPTERRFYFAPIDRDMWFRICDLARLWDTDTDSASRRVVSHGLDALETEEADSLRRSNESWRARYRLLRNRPTLG